MGPELISAPGSPILEEMLMLEVRFLAIPDVKLIRTKRVSDGRGYFSETYRRSAFADHGILCDFLQDSESCSDRVGTVRGLHFQRPPFAQTKLIRVLSGAIFDVAVDLRPRSPTFGKHVAIELDSESGEQLLVPSGFAHGFCTLQPRTVVFYKVDQVYAPSHDGGVYWADPALAIDWPITASKAHLSEKDCVVWKLPTVGQLAPVFA
jgi:dTDP-4-dehydrorhamnose 3,5-epimerase